MSRLAIMPEMPGGGGTGPIAGGSAVAHRDDGLPTREVPVKGGPHGGAPGPGIGIGTPGSGALFCRNLLIPFDLLRSVADSTEPPAPFRNGLGIISDFQELTPKGGEVGGGRRWF